MKWVVKPKNSYMHNKILHMHQDRFVMFHIARDTVELVCLESISV